MTAWNAAAAAIVLGVLTGIAVTWWEFRDADDAFATAPAGAAPSVPLAGPDSRGHGKVVIVGGERFDFGVMQRGETRSHTFIVKNAGLAPLTLTPGQPTCQCTIAKLSQALLAAGQEAELTLEWTAKSYAESFSQGVDLNTSDPDRPVVPIAIVGRVVQAARPVPDELNVGRLSASGPAQFTLMVYSYRSGPFSIERTEFEQAATADYFEVHSEPVADPALLAPQSALQAAKVTVTVKPGLPLGPIQQTIRLVTNLADIAPLEVPIRGTAVSDVSFIAGRNFDPEHNLLQVGSVSGETGKTVVLHLAVKGAVAEQVEVKVASTFPAPLLRAELGEAKAMQGGATVLHKLTVTIPPGSPPANHLGSETSRLGRVEFETTHPSARKITLYVQFAVE